MEHNANSARVWALIRWLFAAAFILAVVLTGRFSGLTNTSGLLFIVFGTVAATLMSFTGRETVTAFRHAAGADGTAAGREKSAIFWEAAVRNAWILGALGSALNFTIVLSTGSNEMQGVAVRMIRSFLVMLYGLVLAVLCLIPAVKLSGGNEKTGSGQETQPLGSVKAAAPVVNSDKSRPVDRIIGYIVFAAILVLNVVFLAGGRPLSGPIPITKALLHWPAVLVVIGGSVGVALFMGAGAGARAWTLGFAMTGLVGLLTGLIQALFGFVNRNIDEVAAALAFIISASSLSLLGLIAVAAPLEDREVMEGHREAPAPLSRLFWAAFPLIAFIFLILTFIMVVTPMTKPAG